VFLHPTSPSVIYTLSLHDALPICLLKRIQIYLGHRTTAEELASGELHLMCYLNGKRSVAFNSVAPTAVVERSAVTSRDLIEYFIGPVRHGLANPIGENLGNGSIEPNHRVRDRPGTRIGNRFGHR